MRLIPALGLAGEETPPRLLPRFAADFDVADLRLEAPLRLVEREEERLRVDLLGTGVLAGGKAPRYDAYRRRDWISGL
jgi:hypothetical protein